MRSGLLGSVAGDVPLQGRLDDVGHLVAALFHEREGFVPHGSDADGADGRLSGRGSSYHAKNVTQKPGPATCAPGPRMPFLYYRNRERAGRTEMIAFTADEIRTAALARYGTEPGAAEDIAAATPFIVIEARWSAPHTLHVLYGPALRLIDGTYLPAAELTETYAHMLRGRAAQNDTPEAAARRATRKALADVTLPIEFEAAR